MCFHFCVLPGGGPTPAGWGAPPVGWGRSVVITCLDNRRAAQ